MLTDFAIELPWVESFKLGSMSLWPYVIPQ
jgi:hypothetical protein